MMMRSVLVVLVSVPLLAAAAGPDYKYQTFYDGWKKLKASKKADNKAFYTKIGEMAAAGENGVKTLKDKSGKTVLHYVVHASGDGSESPKAGTECDCNYKGVTLEGKQFDSSFDRGEATQFAPNQVITGWTQAMQQMVPGDMWEMYIPAENAYGESGAGGDIPGGATLIFIMKMEKINGSKQPRKLL